MGWVERVREGRFRDCLDWGMEEREGRAREVPESPTEPREIGLDRTSIRCLSFDCYGTLVDWETGLSHVLGEILGRHAVAVESPRLLELFAEIEAEVEASNFIPYREVLRSVLQRLGALLGFSPSAADLHEFSGSVARWPVFPDTVAALRALGAKYRLVVLSNVDDDLFAATEKALGVAFDGVFTAQAIGAYKPSRENFEYLIQHAGVAPDAILHVAQSVYHDIGPARQVGLACAWVKRRGCARGSGATPPAEVIPHVEVPDMKSLARLLL